MGQGQAQWQLVVDGHFGDYGLVAPIGSKPITIGALFGYPSPEHDTGIQPITLSQDSIQGDGFTPETGGEYGNFNQFNFVASYSFVYTPKYEDTSIVLITATSAAPPYSQQVHVVAITIIASSNQYSLSRSDFGLLSAGDTSQAELLLFNQTSDTEWVSASLSEGIDFRFLETASFPVMIPPGDSLFPIHLIYRASPLRPSSSDSISISVQRVRDGGYYRSPILFGKVLTGRCKAKYCKLSKTKFGYIASGDSSVGFLKLFNPTEDTETVSAAFIPEGDFRVDEGVDIPVLLLPYDSTQPIPITMHASVNRKAIRDTLSLSFAWFNNGQKVSRIIFDTLLSGGCTELRFSVDSIYKHFVSTLGKKVVDSVMVHNLINDSLFLYTSFWIQTEDFNDLPYYNFNFGVPQVIAPLSKVAEVFSFDPSVVGYQYAGLTLTNWYFGTGDSADTADVLDVSLEGFGLPADAVSGVNDRNSLSIYPNPSSNGFRIQGLKRGAFFVIYNILGSSVFHSREGQSIWDGRDDSGVPSQSGQYFAVIKTANRRYTIPIVVQR